MVCLIWKFSRSGWLKGQHFYQATQNGARTAIVFARQSKTHILKSSGFWCYNIITHWGHPGKGMQKSKQNKCESKESWIEPNGHNRDKSRIQLIVIPLYQATLRNNKNEFWKLWCLQGFQNRNCNPFQSTLQVFPSVPPFVFTVLLILFFNVLKSYFWFNHFGGGS